LFQICIYFFVLLSTNEDILKKAACLRSSKHFSFCSAIQINTGLEKPECVCVMTEFSANVFVCFSGGGGDSF